MSSVTGRAVGRPTENVTTLRAGFGIGGWENRSASGGSSGSTEAFAEKYGIESSEVLTDADRVAINRENALTLFPRFG